MSITTLLIAGFILFTFLLIALNINTVYYPAVFFLIRFVGERIFSFERVRESVAFQIAVLSVLFLFILIQGNGKVWIKDSFLINYIPYIVFFILLFITVGFIRGNRFIPIMIDSYKYIDIIVLYCFFRAVWTNNEDLLQGLRVLSIEMIVFGIIELFITSRGGIGLNLLMSLFPMVILLAIYSHFPFVREFLILVILIVASSQTRTYIVGFAFGILAMLCILGNTKRAFLLRQIAAALCIVIFFVFITKGRFLDATIQRFAELKTGFEVSGGYRLYDNREALKRFWEHPIYGTGFGYLKTTFIPKMGWIEWGSFTHCFHLELLFKTGIIGFGFSLFHLGRFSLSLWRKTQDFKESNDFMFSLCCGGVCSLLVWLLTYTFTPLSTLGSMFLGVIIAGIGISNYHCGAAKLDHGIS